MMVVGGLCALIHGAASPLMLLVYGQMTDTFVSYELEMQELRDPNKTCINSTVAWVNGSIYQTAENATVLCGCVILLLLDVLCLDRIRDIADHIFRSPQNTLFFSLESQLANFIFYIGWTLNLR